MWEQQSRRDKQRSAPFWIPKWQPDYLQAISMSKYESNTVEKTGKDQCQSEFSNDNQMTYKLWYDSNTEEETDMDQQYSEFSNNNQITYLLWMWQWQSKRDRGRSILFEFTSDNQTTHLL